MYLKESVSHQSHIQEVPQESKLVTNFSHPISIAWDTMQPFGATMTQIDDKKPVRPCLSSRVTPSFTITPSSIGHGRPQTLVNPSQLPLLVYKLGNMDKNMLLTYFNKVFGSQRKKKLKMSQGTSS